MRVFPILFVALTDAKSALMGSGLIARLMTEIPHADITLLATPEAAMLYKDDPRIGRIQVLEEPVYSLSGMNMLLNVARRTYGLVVDIGPSAVSRAPLKGWVRAKTWATLKPSSLVHPAQAMAGLLRLDEPVTPELMPSEARLSTARGLFSNDQANRPLIVMAPGASWIGRRWPAERFAKVALRLLSEDGPLQGARLLIVGDEEDRHAADALRRTAPRGQVVDMTGKIDPLTAFAALKDADAFMGNEGLWLHLAAAAGVPTFGLYGPDDESLQAPLGDHVHIIRGPRSLKQIRTVDPELNQEICHMTDLRVDEVVEAVHAALPQVRLMTAEMLAEPAQIIELSARTSVAPPRPRLVITPKLYAEGGN